MMMGVGGEGVKGGGVVGVEGWLGQGGEGGGGVCLSRTRKAAGKTKKRRATTPRRSTPRQDHRNL